MSYPSDNQVYKHFIYLSICIRLCNSIFSSMTLAVIFTGKKDYGTQKRFIPGNA